MKRRGMSLALCAAMAMGTIGVVPAMADDVTTITYWVNDRHDSEYMTEMVEKYNKENTDNFYIDMRRESMRRSASQGSTNISSTLCQMIMRT